MINVIYRDLNSHRAFNFYIFKTILYTLNKNVIRFNNQILNNFFKIKTIYINHNQIVDEKNNFLLFIELINVFKSIFLSSHHLKLKKDYMIILLRNL